VAVGHPDAVRRIALEVELDDNRRLVADDPAIVPGLDRDDGRSRVLAHAAVRETDVDAAARKETDVRVHALVGMDQRLHVRGPAEADRVDHPLDSRIARAHHLELHAADVTSLGAPQGRHQWIDTAHAVLPRGCWRRV
jgi:hypothetical protein